MPMPSLDELLSQYQAKDAEATALIELPNATGPQLTKAERLFDERDAIAREIEGRKGDVRGSLRDRAAAGKEWLNQPAGPPPLGSRPQVAGKAAGGPFRVSGMEDAGVIDMAFDARMQAFRAVSESGPGTFGEKAWGAISSFEYKAAFAQYLRQGKTYLDGSKTLMEGIDAQGGVFAPAELIMRVIGRSPAPTQLRSLVNGLNTGRDALTMPRKQYNADDRYTTAFRATWTGEIPSDGTGNMHAVDDANLLGNISIPVHTAMLSAPVSRNLIEDSAFAIQPWLESELNQTIDLLYEDMILNGNGVGQPVGILFGANSSNVGLDASYPEVIVSGTPGEITHDTLVDVQMALAPQYENENTRWVMNKRSTYRALNKLKDGNGRPLFTTGAGDYGLAPGRGRVLLGDPVVLSAFMPDLGANNFPVVYGDLKGYCLAERVGFSIQVLHETRAKANQVEIVGRVRFGGRPIEPFRLKLLKSGTA